MHLPYQYELLKKPDAVGIRLWVKVPPVGGGSGSRAAAMSAKTPTPNELIGLQVSKTIWLTSGSDLLRVEQTVENPNSDPRMFSLYVQHAPEISQDSLNINWYAPSNTGVNIFMTPDKKGNRGVGKQWIEVPVAGWTAGINRIRKSGLAFMMDYNYLKKIYSSNGTAEWFYDNVLVAPGENFTTEYFVKPIQGFENLVYVSKRIIADIVPTQENGNLKIEIDYITPDTDEKTLNGKLTVFSLEGRKSLFSQNYSLATSSTVSHKLFSTNLKPEKLIVNFEFEGKSGQDQFETWFSNLESWQQSHNYQFRSGMFADFSGTVSPYLKAPPAKNIKLGSLAQKLIINKNKQEIKILVIYGLYTKMLRIWDALSLLEKDGVKVSVNWINCPPNGVESFPGSYQELADYDLTILADVNQKALGQRCLNMIRVCVENGRGLLMTGGPYTFGNGEFTDKDFLGMLPVEFLGPFDLKWVGKEKSWQLQKTASPILNAVTFKPTPKVYWMHEVRPKKDSETIMTTNGGMPALITGAYGKGRVAVLALSPTGRRQDDSEIPWWDWTDLPVLGKNLLLWLRN